MSLWIEQYFRTILYLPAITILTCVGKIILHKCARWMASVYSYPQCFPAFIVQPGPWAACKPTKAANTYLTRIRKTAGREGKPAMTNDVKQTFPVWNEPLGFPLAYIFTNISRISQKCCFQGRFSLDSGTLLHISTHTPTDIAPLSGPPELWPLHPLGSLFI